MLGDVGGDVVDDLAELVTGEGRFELAVHELQRQLQATPMPAVDDRGQRVLRPHQQASGGLERPHGGR